MNREGGLEPEKTGYLPLLSVWTPYERPGYKPYLSCKFRQTAFTVVDSGGYLEV